MLLYVGRFTEVNRVPLLVRAHARARERFVRPAPLVLLGGFPGEWEGEHPLATIERIGARHVFLAGWHGHDELPAFLSASDVVVLPSVREQFGQVLVEGMACGLPAIAVDAHGPADIVSHGETGWLVPPDDAPALAAALADAVNRPDERRRRGELAAALVAAVNDPAERRRRGARADRVARARYGWPALAARVGALYDDVVRNDVA